MFFLRYISEGIKSTFTETMHSVHKQEYRRVRFKIRHATQSKPKQIKALNYVDKDSFLSFKIWSFLIELQFWMW